MLTSYPSCSRSLARLCLTVVNCCRDCFCLCLSLVCCSYSYCFFSVGLLEIFFATRAEDSFRLFSQLFKEIRFLDMAFSRAAATRLVAQTAGRSSIYSSRILPQLALQAQVRSVATSTPRFAGPSMHSPASAHTAGSSPPDSNDLPGSSAKGARSDPGAVVGGRVGVIAPSQALTDDWSVNRAYPDYSKGPSALDKASRLFFFTEILRGMWVV